MSSMGPFSNGGIDVTTNIDPSHDNIVFYKAMAMLMASATMMYFLFKNFYRIMTGGTDSKTIGGLTAQIKELVVYSLCGGDEHHNENNRTLTAIDRLLTIYVRNRYALEDAPDMDWIVASTHLISVFPYSSMAKSLPVLRTILLYTKSDYVVAYIVKGVAQPMADVFHKEPKKSSNERNSVAICREMTRWLYDLGTWAKPEAQKALLWTLYKGGVFIRASEAIKGIKISAKHRQDCRTKHGDLGQLLFAAAQLSERLGAECAAVQNHVQELAEPLFPILVLLLDEKRFRLLQDMQRPDPFSIKEMRISKLMKPKEKGANSAKKKNGIKNGFISVNSADGTKVVY